MAKPKFHCFMATKLQALLDKITALWLHFFFLPVSLHVCLEFFKAMSALNWRCILYMVEFAYGSSSHLLLWPDLSQLYTILQSNKIVVKSSACVSQNHLFFMSFTHFVIKAASFMTIFSLIFCGKFRQKLTPN